MAWFKSSVHLQMTSVRLHTVAHWCVEFDQHSLYIQYQQLRRVQRWCIQLGIIHVDIFTLYYRIHLQSSALTFFFLYILMCIFFSANVACLKLVASVRLTLLQKALWKIIAPWHKDAPYRAQTVTSALNINQVCILAISLGTQKLTFPTVHWAHLNEQKMALFLFSTQYSKVDAKNGDPTVVINSGYFSGNHQRIWWVVIYKMHIYWAKDEKGLLVLWWINRVES